MQMWQSCAPVAELTFDLGDQPLAARAWGEPHLPIIVALHGWLDNANSFAPLAALLAPEFYVLAIDWPGHGLSAARPGHYPLHWVDYLYDLQRLLPMLSAHGPVILLGHSLGGLVASAYSAVFPEQVASLLLIEALVPLFETAELAKVRLRKSFAQMQQKAQQGRQPCDLATAVATRHRLTGLAPEWCQLILARNMEISATGSYWRTDPRLRTDSPQRMTLAQVQALIDGNPVPSLYINGRDGYASLAQLWPQVAPWFQDLTKVELTGNHHLHMQNAAEVALHIKAFLQQRKAKAGTGQDPAFM